MTLDEQLVSDRFFMRSLSEEDATGTYQSWIAEPSAQKYISNKDSFESLSKLKTFIIEKNKSRDALLLGIFDKSSLKHIGNIKYEPISLEEKYAVMGILIGDVDFRGRKVGPEVIQTSSEFLKRTLALESIYLGVKTENVIAVKSYKGMGFEESSLPGLIEPGTDGLCLRLLL